MTCELHGLKGIVEAARRSQPRGRGNDCIEDVLVHLECCHTLNVSKELVRSLLLVLRGELDEGVHHCLVHAVGNDTRRQGSRALAVLAHTPSTARPLVFAYALLALSGVSATMRRPAFLLLGHRRLARSCEKGLHPSQQSLGRRRHLARQPTPTSQLESACPRHVLG